MWFFLWINNKILSKWFYQTIKVTYIKIQAKHEIDIPFRYELNILSIIFELCQGLMKKKSSYH